VGAASARLSSSQASRDRFNSRLETAPTGVFISITPADKNPKFVLPAQAGIQQNTGCRIRHPGLGPGPA